MPIAIDPEATRDYTLRGDTTGTIFKIGLIDSLVRPSIELIQQKIRNPVARKVKAVGLALAKDGITDEEKAKLLADLEKLSGEFNEAQMNIDPMDEAQYFYELIRFGLKGWDNFNDAAGKPVPFVTVDRTIPFVGIRKIASDESLMKLKETALMELALEVNRDNFINNQELKNL
jgi:hypothetical protein